MHHLTRAAGALLPAVALTFGALAAADAAVPGPTVEDRLDQIALVDDPVPLDRSPVSEVTASGRLALGDGDSAMRLALPVDGPTQVGHAAGRVVLRSDDATRVAVAPTTTGAQVLVGIESDQAPTSFDFDLDAPPGLTAEVSAAGTVDLADAGGDLVAQIETPWAIDAEGRHVPTRFEVRGDTVTQVVDHRSGDYAYPIVADPKVKFCDFATAVCVKFSKSETKTVAKAMSSSVAAGVSTLCGKIPNAGGPGLAARAICAVAVNLYFNSVKKAFLKARKAGRCTEAKFRIIGPPVVTAKVVSC